eukprot:6379583-Prymnesium_polylepis.1
MAIFFLSEFPPSLQTINFEVSAPPSAAGMACEPCNEQVPRNCGHFWVTRSHHARNDLRDLRDEPDRDVPGKLMAQKGCEHKGGWHPNRALGASRRL